MTVNLILISDWRVGLVVGHPTAAAKQQMNMGWTSLLLEEKRLLLQKAE